MAALPSLTVEDWHRLNRLLEAGLKLEGTSRTAWLDSLEEADRHLRAVLLELLSRGNGADLAGTSETLRPVVDLAAAAMAAMRGEAAGDRIGPWRLERLLAEGGMGAVWVAERADGVMKRTAALKLPRAEWVDHGLSQRLARERGILARLKHPAIAVLYDAGLAEGGRPYLALEYVDGVPIDAWCSGRSLPEVLRLFIQVVRAVAYAHGQLVIHRDLKPANVLVTPDGAPKLLDFGISKLIEGDTTTAEATALTRLAGRPMTLAYAAPEQVLALPITVAADVYALGVMLAELLAGARLYRAREPRALEAEILTGDLRLASSIATDRTRARALKGDLDAIVSTALKRQPAERYDSAAALADDLQRYLDGQPVRARPDSTGYRLKKFVGRYRLPVAAGAAVLLALGAGLGVALWQAAQARDQAQRATALNSFVLGLIRTADPNASAQTKAADVAMLRSIEERIDNDFKGSPDQLLQLRVTVGEAYKNRGEMMAARRVFQKAVDEAAAHIPQDDLTLLTARVRASDPDLIVSTEVAAQLDRTIEILRARRAGSAAAADLLIDALLIRHELESQFGVPAYVATERRLDTLKEANAVALAAFGEGSRQQLRAVRPLADWTIGIKDETEGVKMLDAALEQARLRTDGTVQSIEYLWANAEQTARLCNDPARRPRAQEQLRQLMDEVRNAHGPTSVLLERLVLVVDACSDEGGPGAPAAAFEIAAARERPPSTSLLRRAQMAYSVAVGEYDWPVAERYYAAAIENSAAIPEPALRARLMRPLDQERVCHLAQRGDAAQAEAMAAPIRADFDAAYARMGRLTPGQGSFWLCVIDAQRQQGRYDEAAATAQMLYERCAATAAVMGGIRCTSWALAALTTVQLDAGRIDEARAAMDKRLKLPRGGLFDLLSFAHPRILMADGRASEAIEPLRRNYGYWLSTRPDSPYAAEALYWFGQAYRASGDPRGRWMIAQAREALARSPNQAHRRLSQQPDSHP
jgi:tetratricopeptide (TPR) repeat protein/tRNA A-37 threonylcarbamoyl transferase component Bud32